MALSIEREKKLIISWTLKLIASGEGVAQVLVVILYVVVHVDMI